MRREVSPAPALFLLLLTRPQRHPFHHPLDPAVAAEDKFIDVDDFCAFCNRVGLFKNRDEMVAEFNRIVDGNSGKLIFVEFCRWFCRVRAASAKAKAAAER